MMEHPHQIYDLKNELLKKKNAVKEIVSISGDLHWARNLNLFINLFISVTSIHAKPKWQLISEENS